MKAARLTSIVLALVCGVCSLPSRLDSRHTPTWSNATKYDYIIVGGGPAGFVLAEQLSQNPRIHVALLEAGPDASALDDIYIPGFVASNGPSAHVWNYTVVPQKTLGGLQPALFQGRLYGGGTGINAMNYNRGDKSVMDDWARISGNHGLAWDSLFEDFKSTVTFVEDLETLNYTQTIDPNAYGNGPISISRSLTEDGFDPSWNEAMRKTLNIPEVDFNAGNGYGVSDDVYSIRPSNRTRSYALTAYGYPMAGRPNVHMLHDAYVNKIHFNGKHATAVTYVNGHGNSTVTLSGKEIIVSAGAIGSPKLLMLSGVGPAAHLKSHNISVVLDAPDVGSNLRDHNYGTIEVQVNPDVYTISRWQDAGYLNTIMQQWQQQHDGPLADCPSGSFSVIKVPDSALPGRAGAWHRALPKSRGQLMMQYANVAVLANSSASTLPVISAWVALTQPEASGSVRLSSANYLDFPLIDTNYFGTKGDQDAVLYGYKRLREVLQADELKDVIVKEIYPGPNVTTDGELWNAIINSAQSYHHPMGTVALGTVLDADFRVKGLRGLRVIDSSAFPTPPNVHIQAHVYAMAHMAARQIRRTDRWEPTPPYGRAST